MPAGARATPMPFQAGDREYVLINVGGNDDGGKGDYVISFALER